MCITESVLIWDVDDDGQRGEAEKRQYRARQNRNCRREQRLEARRPRERRRRALMSTEQRQMLLQQREAKHRTESIAENQPLEIPSFCTRDRDLPIPIKANRPMMKSNVSVYYCILLVVHSFTFHTESEVYY